MPNLSPLLSQRIPEVELCLLTKAAEASARAGVALFLVGGTVRDVLLGHRPADQDLSAEGDTDGFADTLARELGGEVTTRSQFGTAKVRVGGATIDLALARTESYAAPGALPEVTPGSIQEDLARRDFSINAMAIALEPGRWGELIDPSDGAGDLERRVVRVLHPGSFRDDATRILRAVRYAGRLGFGLHSETEALMRRDLSYLDTIKGDRVRHELERIFVEEGASAIIALAQDLGVLAAIYPPLTVDGRMMGKLRNKDVGPGAGSPPPLLAALVYPLSPGARSGIIARLNMDSRWARVVRDTGSVRNASGKLNVQERRRSELYAILHPLDPTAIRGCAMATDDPLVAERLGLYLTELRQKQTLLSGDDVIALGVPQGPMVGELLDRVLAARLDGLVTSREEEEQLVVSRLRDIAGI